MAESQKSPDAPQIRPGFAFHYETDDHLFFVASDFAQPDVLILSFTTVRKFSDRSCVIQPGEHPFVKVETCVAYNFAELQPSGAILEGIARGTIVPYAPLTPELMNRIWDGASVTRHLPLKCRDLLNRQGLT